MEKQTPLSLVAAGENEGDQTAETDGRRQRSERSRKQIIDAMFDLLAKGEMAPGAARIAERAGVGLRTVFRHFEDMDSLYREMMRQAEQKFLPVFMAPFKGETWREQLDELIRRRADMFETIMPLKVAAGMRRFQSQFLMDSHHRFRALEESGLQAVLPDSLCRDEVLFGALEVSLSFHAWRRMRQDQSLSPEQALGAMQLTAEALLQDR